MISNIMMGGHHDPMDSYVTRPALSPTLRTETVEIDRGRS
jgi:hypothetical protein